jgi:O-antigen ligase
MSTPELTVSHNSTVYRQWVLALLMALAALLLVPLATGTITITMFTGLIFGLVFIGFFMTDLRLFILVYVALRALLEFFLEPTRIPIGGYSIQLIGVLGVVILLGGFVYIVINQVRIMEISVVGPMIIFLVATLPTTLMFSLDKAVGFKDWVGTASAVILFILIASIFTTRKNIRLLLVALVLSSIPPLIVGFYQLFTGTGNLKTEGFNRIQATFSHPNSYAVYLMMLLLLCIPLLLEAKKDWLRLGLGAICVAMFASLIFTYARAPWLDMFAGLAILSFVRYRKLLLLAPVGVVVLLVFVPSILERFQEASGFSEGQGSLFFRVEMWRYLLPRFYSNPIVGNGLGSFSVFAEQGLGYFYLPHNDYVRILVDTGVVGLFSYLAALYGLARGSLRAYLTQTDELFKLLALVMMAVIATYLLGGLTENLFRAGTTQAYFWTLAGLVAASARIVTMEREKLPR